MDVGLVGCGQIGHRRAAVLSESDDRLVVAADDVAERVQRLATEFSCRSTAVWQEVVSDPSIDTVMVATTHEWLAPVTKAALENGKHVLVEKPMARNSAEAESILESVSGKAILKVGYNHRHHPAVSKARELLAKGAIGAPLYIRCRYGHGGRPGYGTEWRADREKSGGGELLDQGIHCIDLGRWFLGNFIEATGLVDTYVWNSRNEPPGDSVEDNAFALLRTESGQTMSLHASWTQWKNLFSFELFGEEGHLIVEGLGGSYGTETLTIGKRNMQGGPPNEETLTFDEPDNSWHEEWQEFKSAIEEGRQPLASGEDGLQALRAVQAVYESARTGRVVPISR